jgi:hypothetical protein
MGRAVVLQILSLPWGFVPIPRRPPSKLPNNDSAVACGVPFRGRSRACQSFQISYTVPC